jgi:hypothetical protein
MVEFGGGLIDMVDLLSDVSRVFDLGLGVDSVLFELAITTARANTSDRSDSGGNLRWGCPTYCAAGGSTTWTSRRRSPRSEGGVGDQQASGDDHPATAGCVPGFNVK